jgi:hypothetical protein
MNKEQKQIMKQVNQAYSKLHVLSNLTWTPYRDEIFDMNKKVEKRHRKSCQDRVFDVSINDCAKFFTVQNIAESLLTPNKWKVKDLINIRKSCLYAQSVVENYKETIVKAWKDENIKQLAEFDYIALINWELYTEQQERKVA